MPDLAYRHQLARKSIHVASAVLAAALLTFLPLVAAQLALAAVVSLAMLIEYLRLHDENAAHILGPGGVVPLFRPGERHHVSGATTLWLGLLIPSLLGRADLAIAVALMVGFGDAAAALVGQRYGRHRWFPHGRSVEGSVACFSFALLGGAHVFTIPYLSVVVAALAMTGAEAFWPRRDDNLVLPIVAAVALLAAGA